MATIDWDEELENESGRYEPDEIEILEELYTQERTANDQIIEALKSLATATPDDALAGIRRLLDEGYMYFGEVRPWDRPKLDTLIGYPKQLDMFEECEQ
jgi:hypothetical protein